MNNNLTTNLAPIKRQVSVVVNNANNLSIFSSKDLVKAADIRTKIKSAYKIVKERMEAPIKRAYQAYKDIRLEQDKTFGVFIRNCEDAERIVSRKMVEFNQAEEAKAAKETAKIEVKVEKGKMNMEEAAEKIEAVVPDNKVEGKNGSVHFRTIKKVVIEDESKLPREFLIPDMVKIRRVALAGVEIAGVKVEDEKVVASGR